MMNRELAHGRHLEWGLRASERCNPQGASDGEPPQSKQHLGLRKPIGPWLPPSNESMVSVVRHVDGIWPDTMAAVA